MNALFNKRLWTEIIALLILNIVSMPPDLVGLVDQSTIINHQSSISKRVIGLEPNQLRYRILIVDDNPDTG